MSYMEATWLNIIQGVKMSGNRLSRSNRLRMSLSHSLFLLGEKCTLILKTKQSCLVFQ